MKYTKLIIFLFVPCLISCGMLRSNFLKHGESVQKNSDSLTTIYGDSIDSIIFSAEDVSLYDMEGLVLNNDSVLKQDSLFNYHIKKKMGNLDSNLKNLLQFIIEDRKFYIASYPSVKQPFNPDFALVFSQKKDKAFMFVSFGTEEISISDEKGNFKFYLMRDKRLLARWASKAFTNDNYYKILI